jgi:hypothetical protein
METPVEIRYAGVKVASATEILRTPGNDTGMFLVVAEPLPVGTVVQLGDGSHARVEKVVESADPHSAGMYVRLLAEAEVGQPWEPQLPESIPLPPPRRVPTPTAVPLVSPRVAEARPSLGENGERRPNIMGPVPPPAAYSRSAGTVMGRSERQTIVVAAPPAVPVPPPEGREPTSGRERRDTLVAAVPPPAEAPPAVSSRASGEFQSRPATPVAGTRVETAAQINSSAKIVIADPDSADMPDDGPVVEDSMASSPSEDMPAVEDTGERSLEDLAPARPLPPPDGRRRTARRRSKNR